MVSTLSMKKKERFSEYTTILCVVIRFRTIRSGRFIRIGKGESGVGTNAGGINYLSSSVLKFTRYIPLSREETISSKRIREIIEDNNQNIWISTEDAGVNIFSPEKQTFKKLGRDIGRDLTSEQTLSLLNLNGDIWVGLFKKGLDIVSAGSYNTRLIPENS